MTLQDRPTPSGIVEAAAAIDPVFTQSPLISSEAVDEGLGCRLFLKVETLNPIRSFKGRGTDWWFANLPTSDQPVVCASAGNFGQGVAYAARRRGRKAIVFASRHANAARIAARGVVVTEGAGPPSFVDFGSFETSNYRRRV